MWSWQSKHWKGHSATTIFKVLVCYSFHPPYHRGIKLEIWHKLPFQFLVDTFTCFGVIVRKHGSGEYITLQLSLWHYLVTWSSCNWSCSSHQSMSIVIPTLTKHIISYLNNNHFSFCCCLFVTSVRDSFGVKQWLFSRQTMIGILISSWTNFINPPGHMLSRQKSTHFSLTWDPALTGT